MTANLTDQIRQFYDASSALWEATWGEHMHHGYYGPNGTYRVERRQAQVDLIDALLAWAEVSAPQAILDAGCGIGGSTLYLARQYGARATGITLSPVQAERAQARAQAAGLGDRVNFQVADALATPFPDASFDLIWSLESGEHMPDKAAFLRECYRLLAPGGQLVFVTWCHRPTHSLAGPLVAAEESLLQAIYDIYYLPYVLALPAYEAIARDCGFVQLRADDWSTAVAPFWDAVIASALDPRTWLGILRAGPDALRGTAALLLMRQGYASGLIRFGVLTARKPV